MNRKTLLMHTNYIIVQHSHYKLMKIHRKSYLTTYHIQKMLAHNKEFDLTDMFFHNYSFQTNNCGRTLDNIFKSSLNSFIYEKKD